ncbi:Hypothetical protein DEACI_4208 [Acididesulfobacillus acetoxydans]|uniref:FlxA-like protein n=1 Tax=Acididesulfobacillus acetoxydans TaxID=1561005 RepID=A0A8S0Y4X2_9FIRM|nr:hypothetical protein [Acididesulfobacillus acetoxydans]CAA7603385.1 Hypothetical protein DEACI_4208 [Acididesulfobacillus acetoxydans]CEJ08316.1 Hypothetical protein DEACI_2792 [Acididesulfobacillus acetoxydans]
MVISAISGQANPSPSLFSSLNASNVSMTVTASDPTLLARQAQQLTNQITQLQGKNGSAQQVQKLQQVLQMVKDRIQQQQRLARERQADMHSAAAQPVSSGKMTNNLSRHIDVQA